MQIITNAARCDKSYLKHLPANNQGADQTEQLIRSPIVVFFFDSVIVQRSYLKF